MKSEYDKLMELRSKADELTKDIQEQHLVVRREDELQVITAMALTSNDNLLYMSFANLEQ